MHLGPWGAIGISLWCVNRLLLNDDWIGLNVDGLSCGLIDQYATDCGGYCPTPTPTVAPGPMTMTMTVTVTMTMTVPEAMPVVLRHGRCAKG